MLPYEITSYILTRYLQIACKHHILDDDFPCSRTCDTGNPHTWKTTKEKEKQLKLQLFFYFGKLTLTQQMKQMKIMTSFHQIQSEMPVDWKYVPTS